MSRVKAYRPAPMPASVMDLAEVFPVFPELWTQALYDCAIELGKKEMTDG